MEYLSLDNARSWIKTAALSIAENATMLTELDTAIGDGDHGENMRRGFAAIEKKLDVGPAPADLSSLFKLIGMTLLSSVGGAAGPLYGGFFLALSKASTGKEKLSKAELGEVLTEGLADIQKRGKAQLGDKTMVDALVPALEAYRAAPDSDISVAVQAAVEQAQSRPKLPSRCRRARAVPAIWANAASDIRIPAPPRAGYCCKLWPRRARVSSTYRRLAWSAWSWFRIARN